MLNKPTPFLWFNNRIAEAISLYSSVFPNTQLHHIQQANGVVTSATISINEQTLVLFNGGPAYAFSPAISFMVQCQTQEEIDTYWDQLTANGGKEGRCGWLTDPFGLSWQIIPHTLPQLLSNPLPQKAQSVMEAMLKMNKLHIETLQQAGA